MDLVVVILLIIILTAGAGGLLLVRQRRQSDTALSAPPRSPTEPLSFLQFDPEGVERLYEQTLPTYPLPDVEEVERTSVGDRKVGIEARGVTAGAGRQSTERVLVRVPTREHGVRMVHQVHAALGTGQGWRALKVDRESTGMITEQALEALRQELSNHGLVLSKGLADLLATGEGSIVREFCGHAYLRSLEGKFISVSGKFVVRSAPKSEHGAELMLEASDRGPDGEFTVVVKSAPKLVYATAYPSLSVGSEVRITAVGDATGYNPKSSVLTVQAAYSYWGERS